MLQRNLMGMYQLRKKNKTLLPSGYQQVEYLESTGTQYINSGVVISQVLRYRVDLSIHEYGVGGWFIGASGNGIYYLNDTRINIYVGTSYNATYPVVGVQTRIEFIESQLFLDGVLTRTYTTTPTGSSTFNLGASSGGNTFRIYVAQLYDGATLARSYIPCIRKTDSVAGMYDTVNHVFTENAGTGSFIAGPYVNAEAWTPAELSPLAWYKGEGNALDSAGTNDGTWVGTEAYIDGKISSAAYCTGANYISVTNAFGLGLTSKGSIGLWINPTTSTQNGNYVGLVTKAVGGHYPDISYSLHWRDNSVIRFLLSSGSSSVGAIEIPKPNVGIWTHLLVTFDGSAIACYTNGTLSTSALQTGSAQSVLAHPVEIGGRGFGVTGKPFKGVIDDVLIFDRALTSTEITKLYNESVYRGGVAWPAIDEQMLTFTYADSYPSSITLNSLYPGPANPTYALYDNGDGTGWREYTSNTITLGSNTVKFKGDWRDSSGRFYNMFYATFAADYPVAMSGCFTTAAGNPISGTFVPGMFMRVFASCSGLTGSIPSGLFGTISGTPAANMFYYTFYGCVGLTGSIPSGLFGTISGTPAANMFQATFANCSGLTGSIPSGLFGNITGAPTAYMFYSTFYNCSGLTGSIPSGLFGNITGAPATLMFNSVFSSCHGLTDTIPSGLFGDLSGTPATAMFNNAFRYCYGLTGASATMSDGTTYLYSRFSTATTTEVGDCYFGCTGLTDYATMPSAWK